MLKRKKRNSSTKVCIKIKELKPEGNQSGGFQESFGYAAPFAEFHAIKQGPQRSW